MVFGKERVCGCDRDLEAIEHACWQKREAIRQARDIAVTSVEFSLLRRMIFWLRAGGLGRYGRTGKVCQSTTNADTLFEEASVLNDDFFEMIESAINVGGLERVPVKRPDRAFQKVARKYLYDAHHLTDLVRCCILVDSISDARRVLDHLFGISFVFGSESHSSTREGNKKNADGGVEAFEVLPADVGRAGGGDGHPKQRMFNLCKVKDNFTRETGLGYRYICLNLEVGWTVESESIGQLCFVPAIDFEKKQVRTHICEVQVLLKSTFDLKDWRLPRELCDGWEYVVEVRKRSTRDTTTADQVS